MSDEALDLFLGVTIERVLVRLVEAEKGGVTGPGCGAGLLLWREIYRALTESRDAIAAAVARLALLESVLAEAGEALEPFAKGAKVYSDPTISNDTFLDWGDDVTAGDLRRAASVSNQIAGMKDRANV